MKRAGILAALVAAVTLGMGGVAQADSVLGIGTVGPNNLYFEVQAQSGPSGENVTGFMVFEHATMGPLDGSVTRLCASGNTSVVSGAIIAGAPLGTGFIIHVQDNASVGTPDQLCFEFTNYIPAACPAFALSPALELASGDLAVIDEVTPPPPPPAVTFDNLSALTVQYVLASGEPGANGVANALASQLAAAQKAAERGNDNAKIATIGAFISTVSHLDRFLTPEQMDELIAMAAQL